MTIFQLQKDLAEEIEFILSDMIFKDPKGKPAHMKSYEQKLPKREQTIKLGNLMSEETDDEDPYPFCIVRMESGAVYAEAQKVRTILVFGIFDDEFDNQGDKILMNVLNRVSERFIRNPVLKNMYRLNCENGINWILDDEERYPYYIGGMEMEWDAYFIGKEEDRYA